MDDFQKSVFIEYYFNSIDFIAKEAIYQTARQFIINKTKKHSR